MSEELTIIPVKYKVTTTDKRAYYIERFNLQGEFKWYALLFHETFPDFFRSYPGFKDGFESPDMAVEQLKVYLENIK